METNDDSHFETIQVEIDPYGYVVDSGFENANQDIVSDGVSYHVFKKRIQNNVLTLYCLRNLDNEKFDSQLKKVVASQLFDSDSDNDQLDKRLMSSFFKDYIPHAPFAMPILCKAAPTTAQLSGNPRSDLLPGYPTTNYLPPNIG